MVMRFTRTIQILQSGAAIILILLMTTGCPMPAFTQPLPTEVMLLPAEHRVRVTVGGEAFTSLIYPDSLEKPVLFPIYAPHQQLITRGFPLDPRGHEPTDHPHHIGLWLNYENVNGLDFWNNSAAIPADQKNRYGWIRIDSIVKTASGRIGSLVYRARWEDQQKRVLLGEQTSFFFTCSKDMRIIDRVTVLTAETDIHFPDSKDGLLGLRVAHELELPSTEPRHFSDGKGNISTVTANAQDAITGNYLTSAGKQGDSAWGTRANWCMLYGKIQTDSISIVIIDHPSNPGFPTYWHARGYGLFAANPLGQEVFSKGKEKLDFTLMRGQSVTFRYRIAIAGSARRLSNNIINRLTEDFGKMYAK